MKIFVIVVVQIKYGHKIKIFHVMISFIDLHDLHRRTLRR